nr:probable methyltransferase At1g27930 [Tanacetum cinerariifolium]
MLTELMSWYKKKKNMMLFKVDFEKAYDNVFFLASGLKINVSKSNVFGIGVSLHDIKDMPCDSGSVHFSYLGLPIGANMHLITNWQHLIYRFRAKLLSWKANTLSIGGRLTLIKLFLGSLRIYYMSIFKCLKSVLNSLEAMRASFLWGGSGEKKKMVWFEWENVMASFDKGGILIFTFVGDTPTNLVCTGKFDNFRSTSASMQLRAILHYATTKTTPQQTLNEISISFNVLKSISPCNFLVFGLGHDSLMWASFNPEGPTLFLEEDPKWVNIVLKDAPDLNAVHVKYRTQLKEADDLLKSYKSEPECAPTKSYIRGNHKCKLALTGLPDVVYDKEWDMIMIDAPKGYYPEAPGVMAIEIIKLSMVTNVLVIAI